MIQIFGTTKNFDTKKAQMWFKERRIPFQFVDLKEKEMSRGEFESVVESVSRAVGSRTKTQRITHRSRILMTLTRKKNFLKTSFCLNFRFAATEKTPLPAVLK